MNRTVFTTTESMLFYFLTPALVGFAVGWQQAGFGQFMSKWASIVSWILHFETFWFVGFLSLLIVNLVYSRIRFPKWLFLLSALALTIIFVRPVYWVNYELMLGYALQSGADMEGRIRELIFFEPSFKFFSLIGQLYMHDMVLWPIVCAFILKFGKFPFGILAYEQRAAGNEMIGENVSELVDNSSIKLQMDASSTFARRLKPELGSQIKYIKAEGHYVFVMTEKGEDLVYYRFGDAIIQLADTGIQVHRSYWVSHSTLRDESTTLKDHEIHLETGDKIPIGNTFLQVLKEYA